MDVVDQVARDNAMKALALIDAHERICTERSKEAQTWRSSTTDKLDGMFSTLNTGHKQITKSVDGLYARFWAAALSIISLLVALVAYLVKNHGL